MFDLETISAITFIAIVIILAILDRKNIEFKYGAIMRRTKKGKKWLYDTARKHYKLILKLTTIGVIVGFITSIVTFFILSFYLYNMFTNLERAIEQGPTARLILPQVGRVRYPSFILGVPFWFWLIGIFVVVSVHEPFHALAARLKNVAIKSLGLAMLLVFPIAFVEPNENQIKKLKPLSKMRIYSAGSFANLLTALVAVLIALGLGLLTNNIFTSVGVKFASTLPNTPAQQANLQGTIISISGKTVNDLDNFIKIMDEIKPNETIEIKTTFTTYNLTTTSNPQNSSKAFIGVGGLENDYIFGGALKALGKPSDSFLSAYFWILSLFIWLFIINLGVGSLNLLPIRFLDGGYLYETILQRYFNKKIVDNIITILSIVSVFLIFMSLFGPDILKLFIIQ